MHACGNGYKWEVILVSRGRNKKEGRRKKERERKERKKEREKEKKGREREREKRKSMFRWPELVGLRSKVCIFDEGYASKGRDYSYFGLFPP